MKIDNKYFYFQINAWHHAYLGLVLLVSGLVIDYYNIFELSGEVVAVIGAFVLIDDVIQHILQGLFISRIRSSIGDVETYLNHIELVDGNFINAKYINGCRMSGDKIYLPQFLLHTIFYKYLKINKIKWIRKLTQYVDGLFGAGK